MNIGFAAGMLCLLYYLAIILYSGPDTDFSWIWAAAAVLFLGLGWMLRVQKRFPDRIPKSVWYAVGVLLLTGIFVFGMLAVQVVNGMRSRAEAGLEYCVVLGAHVRGEIPSKALRKRLEAACAYAEVSPDTIFILSGGQGSGEEITEAECMRRYMTEYGVDEKRLIMEAASTTTKENLEYSNKLTGCAKSRTGIISNNFHIYRALRLAEKMGYQRVEGIAAKSDPLMQLHYIVREAAALVKERLTGAI